MNRCSTAADPVRAPRPAHGAPAAGLRIDSPTATNHQGGIYPWTIGYDGKLYILAFDHRGSFQKKMFGIEGDPTPEQTDTIADAKHLIFEGMVKATERGVDNDRTGTLVDEQFGGDIPGQAKEMGLKLAMPVEKSGQNEFDFQYGDDFGEHIESFDPDFAKVLVRHNPDGDAEMNKRQIERLKRLSDWLHENDRKFLFELLVPAEDAQLESVGGDTDRYDSELRAELMRRVIEELPGGRRRGRRVEDRGRGPARGLRDARPPDALRRPRQRGLRAARPGRERRQGRPLAAPGRRGRRLRGLRDRAHHLVGRPEGLPRRGSRPRRRHRQDRRQLPAFRGAVQRGRARAGRCVLAALSARGAQPRSPSDRRAPSWVSLVMSAVRLSRA
ncbi:MAG: DUF2090 domain-containing protein [Thermoleophilaceae bacterium]